MKIKFFFLRQLEKINIFLRKFYSPKEDRKFKFIYNNLKNKYDLNTYDEKSFSVFKVVNHIIRENIDGAFVECGVYKGQKIEVMIETLKQNRIYNRNIFLVDTFTGMTERSAVDYHSITKGKLSKNDLFYSLEDVKKNIYSLGYPEEKIHFIKMDVRKTAELDKIINTKIALLRLDTDYYDSVLSCLNALYKKVENNGFIIHDDFYSWNGHKLAFYDFVRNNNISPKFIRSSIFEKIQIK